MKKFKDLYREEKDLIVAKSHSFTKSEHAPKKKVSEESIEEGSVQDTLNQRHQELRKKSGLPHPDYYKELGKSYDIEDHEQRAKKQAEIRAKYGQQREEVEHLEEMPGANMDTRAVHQHLKKKGWSLTRSSGGHDVFTHPESKEHIAVPRHRQLKAPLVKGILKTASMHEETELEKNSAAALTYKDKPNKESMKKMKEAKEPPFDGPYKKNTDTVTDKSGAKHSPMSQVRDLARKALKKQVEKMKPMKEGLEESRKAEIVKEIVKKKKEKKKESEDTYQAEPILSSEIVKEDK